jgi:hypothetical protein
MQYMLPSMDLWPVFLKTCAALDSPNDQYSFIKLACPVTQGVLPLELQRMANVHNSITIRVARGCQAVQ